MVSRRTDKGLPTYDDLNESDVYLLSGAEDLAPEFQRDANGALIADAHGNYSIIEVDRTIGAATFRVRHYRPRTKGLFSRIERWTRLDDGVIHWRSISKDNVTTLYGYDPESRIADPTEPTRIFSWLIGSTFDDKGQAIRYLYKREDSTGVDLTQAHEGARTAQPRASQIYPYKILYGNAASVLDATGLLPQSPPALDSMAWYFEIAFDYGAGYLPAPLTNPAAQDALEFAANPGSIWPVRPDPFSHYRPTSEVRTCRRCQRVLMIHHFPTELGAPDSLVASTDLAYDDSPSSSAVISITQSGYVRQADGSYLRRGVPAVELEYSHSPLEHFTVDDFEVRELDTCTIANLSGGTADARTSWADLDGEGLPGLLSEEAGRWYYRPNRGEGSFAALQAVTALPLGASLAGGQMLLDLAGDGQLDPVSFADSLPGFFKRNDERSWETFRAFRTLPRFDWRSPYLRFLDLTGDGRADVLVTFDDEFTWYASAAEEGFEAGASLRRMCEQESGPRLVFADERQSIFLADLTGDGLSKLVRVEQGRVCYWPNIGYGRFGAKVVMDGAPWFDAEDVFDHRRIHFFDTDGSGPNDLVYEGRDGIDIYLNQGGNRWSEVRRIRSLPPCHSLSRLDVTDLLGRGTACLVRSTPLPADRNQPMRFIDLMKGVKPRLLIRVVNNLGAETLIDYASSTKFYLENLEKGQPWVSRLPFPVHVVTRVETNDLLSGNRFVTRYSYHHGYFEGEEREFRGFGRVEQLETEELCTVTGRDPPDPATNIDAASYVPPVRTVTWFHTGFFLNRAHLPAI